MSRIARCLALSGALFSAACAAHNPPVLRAPSTSAAPALSPSPLLGRAPPVVGTPPAKAPPPVVTVLYRGPAPADMIRPGTLLNTALLAVDSPHARAFLTHSISASTDWAYEIATVPLSETAPDGAPTARWTAKDREAEMSLNSGSFAPLTGTFESDVARYADIATIVHRPTHNELNGPLLAVSADHIVYERGDDSLSIRDRDGKHPRAFVKGIEAAYRPIFSPDGQTVAFYGCDGAIAARAPNPASCYALYVADVSGKWTRLADVANPGPPVFSTDGRWIYAWSSDDLNADPPKDRGGCLWRVEARAPFARQTLFCSDQLESASLYVDPASETAVVGGAQRGAVDGGVSYAWVSLPDGRLLKTARVPLGDSLSLGTLGPGGHMVTWAGPDLVAVDLQTGKRAVLVPGKTGLTFPSSQWEGDRVYALRTNQGKTEEIVRIDVGSALALP